MLHFIRKYNTQINDHKKKSKPSEVKIRQKSQGLNYKIRSFNLSNYK